MPSSCTTRPGAGSALTDWLRSLNTRRLQRRRARRDLQGYANYVAREQAEVAHMGAAWLQRAQALGTGAPLISVLWLPDPGASTRSRASVCAALQRQTLQRWELLTDQPLPAGAPAHWRSVSPEAGQGSALAARYNRLLDQAQGAWVLLLREGDALAAPHALLLWAEAARGFHAAPVLYAVEDHIDAQGLRHQPHFKCGWNQELQRATHSLGRAYLVRTSLARSVGGLAPALPLEAAEQLLVLRACAAAGSGEPVHVPHVLLHRAGSVCQPPALPAPGTTAQAQAVQQLLDSQGVAVQVSPAPHMGLHLRYAVPRPVPLVSLIVPTRNGLSVLRQCVDSVLALTRYPHFELLIVDNGSDDPDTLAYLAQVQADARVRLRRDDRPFNYSALNNHALADCRGTVIGLLNNDTEVISPDWLDEMVGLACRPDVGAVGARLWFGNRTLQHAGVVLGLGGGAGHAHLGLKADDPGYFGRAWLPQEFSAVTAACMLMRREVFEAVGGLDELHLAVDLNDVDLCLRVRQAGLRVIWTPFAELFHHESISRGKAVRPEQLARLQRERQVFHQRWGAQLSCDPAYHPALLLQRGSFLLADEPRVSLLRHWHPALAGPG